MKLSSRAWSWIIVAGLVGSFAGRCYWEQSQTHVVLQTGGAAVFYRGAFFHKDRFQLAYLGGRWHFWGESGAGDLIVPFECRYNDYRDLRLEENGRVYWIDKEKMTREELRVVNGEWSYDATDRWVSIFDPDLYE